MTTGKRNFNSRLSLKTELFTVFVISFLFLIAGRFRIVTFTYSGNVENTYREQVVSTSEQAISNYSNYISEVVNASDAIQKRLVNETEETITETADNFFDEIRIVTPSISSLSLFDEQGNLIASSSNFKNEESKEEVRLENWFIASFTTPSLNVFSRVDSASLFNVSKYFEYDNGKNVAVIHIVYQFDSIASIIDETRLGQGGHVYIYDNDGRLVYCSGTVTDKEKKIISDTVIGSTSYEESRDSFFLFISTIPKTRWRVAIKTNINELYETKKTFLINCGIYSLVILLVFLFIFFLVSTQISTPLVRLQKERENVENLDFQIQSSFDKKGTKEIESLNHSFEKRRNKIHNLATEILEEQKERNKAELRALQNQINPHFLYNTLDSIIYLIDEDEKEKAQNRIVALSRFFRISISRGKNIILVKDELSHVKYYLQIQKMRFGETFGFEIDAEDKIRNLPIIKLILQPIVENAIVHGFGETTDHKARIFIKGYTQEGFLKFNIKDNGCGILPEKLEEIKKSRKDKNIHNGVGISNVYQRLRIYYGEKADIKIESSPDDGTRIEINIPLSEVKDNEE